MPFNTNMHKNVKTLKGLQNQSDENYQIMYDSNFYLKNSKRHFTGVIKY